ncbi:hypothetical protein CUJ88_12700 [Paraburkholderia hospita]|uniref:Uncharacterized protein n=1 Tax=Paraburkholderia hospita TaxID=169430 RepID=A0AAJ4VXS5_9BURK|nr:hypothetical protein C2L64_12835 [Paraburkholderia hospita]AXE99239.1 hypothetical protein CUJ88_12700 [Paraburkholderia hospita]EIN02356.1 hypothetical protein WQE_04337 [Paraburkholderia hospita]OUL85149.1 hypothetical protein CA602_18585 [Paraburkholderia hospita]OUL93328.1 hypothetical protein CA601_10150 [Paraburkholderia hospita]
MAVRFESLIGVVRKCIARSYVKQKATSSEMCRLTKGAGDLRQSCTTLIEYQSPTGFPACDDL